MSSIFPAVRRKMKQHFYLPIREKPGKTGLGAFA
jgi:hypothetical protein